VGEDYFIRRSNGETMCRGLDCGQLKATFENDPTCHHLDQRAFIGSVR
jgi:hypothetical protein